MKKEFKILSLNISEKKGEQKIPVKKAVLKVDPGLVVVCAINNTLN